MGVAQRTWFGIRLESEENMYTMNVSTRSVETRVVGVTFENRQEVVALLTVGERVSLIREPKNSFDPNAVKVVRWDRRQIGYVERDLASILAPKMDFYRRPIKATVKKVTGGCYRGSSLGVMIRFYLPE
jgi:single-stranded-DNA-specific exonuclease